MGTFDGVHIGHQRVIQHLNDIAQATGGESVLITFDPHPRQLLYPEGPNVQLLNSMEEKAERLKQAGLDHFVILPFTKEVAQLSAFDFVRDYFKNALQAKHVVVGYDHRFGRGREGNFETLQELSSVFGFVAQRMEAATTADSKLIISSTKIRQALAEGNIHLANSMLGYAYEISGAIVHGDARGKTLGFPTANLKPFDDNKIIPSNGVYLVRCVVKGKRSYGVTNIGVRPTFVTDQRTTIETHLLDWSEDIYNEEMKLSFLMRLREEKKFSSLEVLQKAIHEDIQQAREAISQFD
jgi:riboflavin kinase/FMN adenylyltransferase